MNHSMEAPLFHFATSGETHIVSSLVERGTQSAIAPQHTSPWNECTRQIMALPFYEEQASPSQLTRVFACYLVQTTFLLSEKTDTSWEKPLINSTAKGEIVLEWWRSEHELTVYVHEGRCHFLRVWGTNIFNEMDEGDFGTAFLSPLTYLWLWLHS